MNGPHNPYEQAMLEQQEREQLLVEHLYSCDCCGRDVPRCLILAGQEIHGSSGGSGHMDAPGGCMICMEHDPGDVEAERAGCEVCA